jgi:two-component system response regulator CpxR
LTETRKLLAIDDDDKILRIVSTILRREGYEVETNTDPEKGLEQALAGSFDLLILDVMMPRMDGYELFEKLRQDDRTRNLPVLLLTAKGRFDVIHDKSRYFMYGLYGFLSKPFYGRELAHKVNEILGLARREGQSEPGVPAPVDRSEDAPTEVD